MNSVKLKPYIKIQLKNCNGGLSVINELKILQYPFNRVHYQ